MAAAISTSMTTNAARTYIYPKNVTYVMESGSADILYSMVLVPRQDPPRHK
jgi:hypothetical protein